MRTARARIGLAVAAFALLVVGAWYQQRTILCQEALGRRRNTETILTTAMQRAFEAAQSDVHRYCFTWVGLS